MFEGKKIQSLIVYHPGGNFLYRVGEEGVLAIHLRPSDNPGQSGWFRINRKDEPDMYVNSAYVVEAILKPETSKK
jgi:hypothetical protein